MPPPPALTEGIRDAVMLDLAAGGFLDEVAGRAGFTRRTLQRWRKRGEEVLARIESGEDEEGALTSDDALYLSFARGVARARSSAIVRAEAQIHDAMTRHWQAAAWYLERTNPKRYGRLYRRPEDAEPEEDEDDAEAKEAIVAAAKDWKDRKARQAERRGA